MSDNINVSTCRWKYLRENATKYFNPERHTALPEYLEYMFKGHEFVYNTRIPKEIIQSRDAEAPIKLYRPDARCESLNLIVEFDGVPHYQDQLVAKQDRDKDAYLHKLGYIVVRIPYWIQLSRDVIDYLFQDVKSHLTLSDDDKMCELPYSFYDPDKEDPGLNISIGAMCEAGRDRFLNEIRSMPQNIQIQVYGDLWQCCAHVGDDSCYTSEHIIPSYITRKWGIECDAFEYDKIEQMLFGRPFSYLNYIRGISMFDLTYDEYLQHFQELPLNWKVPTMSIDFAHDAFTLVHALSHDPNVIFIQLHGVVTNPLREDMDYDAYVTGFDVVYEDPLHTCNTSPMSTFIDTYNDVEHNIELDGDILYVNVWW